MPDIKTENGGNGDPVLAQFVELRKYIEHSHDGLSKRLDKVEAGQQRLERKVDTRLDGLDQKVGTLDQKVGTLEQKVGTLEQKMDSGFNRLGRKIDALASARRVTPRRRKS